MQSWSIGILCFNEAGTVRKVVEESKNMCDNRDVTLELILVDDGSTDGTVEILREIKEEEGDQVKLILHPENLGIGAGIRDIYFNASHDNVVFIPGDGQFDVNEIIPYLNFSTNELISFYRLENITYSPYRNSLSYINKLFNRLALGLHIKDVNWVKLYKREHIIKIKPVLTSSAIESELVAKLHICNVSIREIPSEYLPRTYGKSRGASWKTLKNVLIDLGKLTKEVNIFRLKKNKPKFK